jgi:hypothetical protein
MLIPPAGKLFYLLSQFAWFWRAGEQSAYDGKA